MALGAYGLGVLSKEVAVTLVAMFLLYYVFSKQTALDEGVIERQGNLYTAVAQTVARYRYLYLSVIAVGIAVVYYYIVLMHASGRIIGTRIGWWGGSMLLNYLTALQMHVLSEAIVISDPPFRGLYGNR